MSSPSSPSSPPPHDRRPGDRRSGTDRRGGQRRLVGDRRDSSRRRAASRAWPAAEPPAEHIRNAIQLLLATLDDRTTLTPAEFARYAQAALSRLTRALAALEDKDPQPS